MPDKLSVRVFQPKKIVLQIIQYPLIPFSCAKITFLESLTIEDKERNTLATLTGFSKDLDRFILCIGRDLENYTREKQYPVLQRWLAQSRLDTYTRLAATVRPEDTEKLALLGRIEARFMEAYSNIPNLVAGVQGSSLH